MEVSTIANTTLVDMETGFQGYTSVAVVCMASIVLIIGVPTNLGLLAAILFSPKLHNLNNFIIANITASGLFQLVAVIPWQFSSIITGVWPFPLWFCHCTFLFALFTVDALVNNMVVLAIYRYFVVVRRQNYFLKTKRVVVTMVVIAWSISILSSLILILGFSKTEFVPRYGRCIQQQTDVQTAKVYKLVTVGGISKGLIPIIFVYVRIFYEVRKKSLVTAHTTNDTRVGRGMAETAAQGGYKRPATAGSLRYRSLTQREVTITLVCVVNFLLFSCCYGPIVTVLALYDSKGMPVPGNLHKVCTLMYWIGNTLNPLAYAVLQKETRDVLLGYLRILCKGRNACHQF